MTQAFVNQGNKSLALPAAGQGIYAGAPSWTSWRPTTRTFEYRQIAVIDRQGNTAAYSGPKTPAAIQLTTRWARAMSPWATCWPGITWWEAIAAG